MPSHTWGTISLLLLGATGSLARPWSIARRGTSGPLYGDSGMPAVDDIQQHHNDCAYVSVVVAVTNLFPEFIKSCISFEGDDFSDLSEVTVTIFNPEMYAPQPELVRLADIPRNDSMNERWWTGALYHAPMQAGFVNTTDGGMPMMLPGNAISLVTGYNGNGIWPEDNITLVWETLQQSSKTPIILQTNPEGCATLWNGDALAVVNATEVDGQKMVGLINTNNDRLYITLDQAFHDTYILWGVEGSPSTLTTINGGASALNVEAAASATAVASPDTPVSSSSQAQEITSQAVAATAVAVEEPSTVVVNVVVTETVIVTVS
ncbi:hypothetical protein IAT38_005001 [Cryptococcus sp. DSM 104549]